MKISSYLSPKCKIAKSSLSGLGVFASEDFEENELIAIWGGAIYTTGELNDLSKKFPEMLTHPVGVFDKFFLGPIDPPQLDPTDRFNHHCDPNAGIKGQILLVARRKILAGEEICYDYETAEIEGFNMKCSCGAKNCRKFLNGNAWKDPVFQKKHDGFFSYFLQEKIAQIKKR